MTNQISAYDRSLGCLAGLAIGDAMGMPTSFLTPGQIRERFGPVDTFLPPEPGHIYHDGLRAGEVTDDTEQSLALLRSYVRMGRVDPRDVVSELLAWARRVEGKYASPLGPSTQRALDAVAAGVAVEVAGQTGDTNGAAMRIAPLGVLHGLLGSTPDAMLDDVELTCLPTHGTDVAISAAAAVAAGIAACFAGPVDVATVLDAARKGARAGQVRGRPVVAPSVEARLRWVSDNIQPGMPLDLAAAALYDLIGAGVAAAETVPMAFGLFIAAEGDPAVAIPLAVNAGGDCDTIAAIVGALSGAFAGVQAIPAAWIETVERVNDLDLLARARELVALAPHWNQ